MSSEFCKRLLSLRKERGMSIKAVAEAIGMKPNTYSVFEKTAKRPNPETIERLANLYKVSIDYLLGDGSEKSPDEKTMSIFTFEDKANELPINLRYEKPKPYTVSKEEKELLDMLRKITIKTSRDYFESILIEVRLKHKKLENSDD